MRLNLDGVETWQTGGGAPPDGWHTFEITDAEEGESSGGHPQIELSLEVCEGESVGCTTRDWVVITDAAMGKVRQLMECAGIRVPEGEFDLNVSAFTGQRIDALIRREPFNGEEKVRIKGYRKPDGVTDVPADTTGLPAAETAAAGSFDSDIPFLKPRIPDRETRRRDLFAGDRFVG